MSNSYNNNSGDIDSNYNTDEEEVVDQVTEEVIQVTEDTTSTFATPADPEGVSVMSIGIIDAYECQEANDIESIDPNDLAEALLQQYKPGVPTHPGGWVGNTMNIGDNINASQGNLLPQFQLAPCLKWPLESGWDYVDYIERSPSFRGPLGNGVERILTIPSGAPRGYGNATHNPVKYQQTSGGLSVRYHMDGIKWRHVMPHVTGIQDDIKYPTEWESGPAFTPTNARWAEQPPGIHTHTGGSNQALAQQGSDVMYTKWSAKSNSGKGWETPSQILIGHKNTKKDPTTMDFGVVGISGFIYPHRSDIDSTKKVPSNELCSWRLNHTYGMYRWDSTDEELEERSTNAEEILTMITEIIGELPESDKNNESYSTDLDNFAVRLYENGKFEEMKNKVYTSDQDGVAAIIASLCEMLSNYLPENVGKSEDDIEYSITGDFLIQYLTAKGQINVSDIFSYIYTRSVGIPDSALNLLGGPIDLEAMVKYSLDEVLDHAPKHRFIFWAFVHMKATDIQVLPWKDGEIEITLPNGVRLTYAEFVHYHDWGWVNICERNGGVLTGNTITDKEGKVFTNERWCVDAESWDLDTEFPTFLMDPIPTGGPVYLEADPHYKNDEIDFESFPTANRYIPNVAPMSGDGVWVEDKNYSNYTTFDKVYATKVRYSGNPPDWSKIKKDFLEKEMTYEFKKDYKLEGNWISEMNTMYEWISMPFLNPETSLQEAGKPALEFWFAPKRNSRAGDWVKVGVGVVQPGAQLKRVTSRPKGSKATDVVRRFMRVAAVCPTVQQAAGPANCLEFMKGVEYNDGRIDGAARDSGAALFDMIIRPAKSGTGDDSIVNSDIGACLHSNSMPGDSPDWYNAHWELPLNSMRIQKPNGTMAKLKRGKYYSVEVQKDSPLSLTHGVYPTFDLWWGRSSECLVPTTVDLADREGLFFRDDLTIYSQDHGPHIIKAKSDYLFFASKESGRTLEQWSKLGETWLKIKTATVPTVIGPAYWGDDRTNPDHLNVMNIEERKWQEPLRTFENGIIQGGQYTIKSNSNAVADYKIIFARDARSLSPRSRNIKNVSMFTSNNYFDPGIIIRKNNNIETHTFIAPSPYLIFCAINNDTNEEDGERNFDNWSPTGEPAGISESEIGVDLTYKDDSYRIKGAAFWAAHGPTNLNQYNFHSEMIINAGDINFNNGYWAVPLSSNSTIKVDDDGNRIVEGKSYEVTITEIDYSVTNPFNGKLDGTYKPNWLLRSAGVDPEVALGDPSRDDQSAYKDYYMVTDQPEIKVGEPKVIVAASDQFSLGLVKGTNIPPMSEWPIRGAKIGVSVVEVEVIEGPAYHAHKNGTYSEGTIPFEDQNYVNHFVKPWRTFAQNGVSIEKTRTYKFTWKPGTHNYELTFWWVDNAAVMGNSYVNVHSSKNESQQYIKMVPSTDPEYNVTVVAMEDNLIFGMVDTSNPTITYDQWSTTGLPVDVQCELVEQVEDNDIVGPAYFAEDEANHLPDLWNLRWEEPLNHQTSFDDALSRPHIFVKGSKYRFKLNAESKMDARIIFVTDYQALSPKQYDIDPGEITRGRRYVDSGVDLTRAGGETLEIYAPSDTIIYGAFNADDNEDGARTLENWSIFGEPIGPDFDDYVDPGLDVTDITPDITVKGEAYWANYGDDAYDVNGNNQNQDEYLINNGQIDFFDEHWIKNINTVSRVPNSEGEFENFVEGEFYDIRLEEIDGYKYGAKYLVNWIVSDRGEIPNPDVPYTTLYANNLGDSDDVILTHGNTVTLRARGTRLSVGAYDITNILTGQDRFSRYQWSPNGQPITLTITKSTGTIQGPSYLARESATLPKGHIDFSDALWYKPFNTFEQNGVPLRRNDNYRIQYIVDENGDTDQIEYTFFWLNDTAVATGVGEKIPSITNTHSSMITLSPGNVEGVVVKCQLNNLVFGAIPLDATIVDWSTYGQPVKLRITATTDPQTDDPVDVIEGPGYYANDEDSLGLPDIGNAHYTKPINFDEINDGNDIDNDNRYRITPGTLTSDYKMLFLMTDDADNPGIGEDIIQSGNYVYSGVTLQKGSTESIEFYAPSEDFIFAAYNCEKKNGEDRTLENWSPLGEPVEYTLVKIPDPASTTNGGIAYWADYTYTTPSLLNPDAGTIQFFNPYWRTPFNTSSIEGVGNGTQCNITITEDPQYAFGGTYVINWMLSEESKYASNTSDTLYETDVHEFKSGVTQTVFITYSSFTIGVKDITNVISGGGNSIYSWSEKGYPIKVEVELIEDISGPAYQASSEGGAIDYRNDHWDSPFNEYIQYGIPIQSNTTYRASAPILEDGSKLVDGLDYSFIFTTEDGLYVNSTTPLQEYKLMAESDGSTVIFHSVNTAGNAYVEFTSPDDDKFKFLIFGAWDPREGAANEVKEWNDQGLQAPITLELIGDLVVGDRGPGYYGSVDENVTLTDFKNEHWERFYHWNISPQNAKTPDNPAPVLFYPNGYFRIVPTVESNEPEFNIRSDYTLYAAVTDNALLLGEDHSPGFFSYGLLKKDQEYIDLKNLNYERIIFCSTNTPNEYTLEGWSPEGLPVNVTVQDLSFDVDRDEDGNYITGPAYFAGYDVENADHHLDSNHFISDLNTVPNIQEGRRYRLVAQSDVIGSVNPIFAKTRESLDTSSNALVDFIEQPLTFKANETIKIRAFSDLMLYSQFNVTNKFNIGEWSRDGEEVNILIYEEPNPPQDGNGDDIEGPAYWADGNPQHKPDFTNYWWETPLNTLLPGRFIQGNIYKLTGGESMPDGVSYKIWYGPTGSQTPTETTVFTTNDEIISKNVSVEIVANEENIYLAAYNTGRVNLSDWSFKGEPAEVVVEDAGTTNIQGSGYYGSQNENFTTPEFSNVHWERIFHWNIDPNNLQKETQYFERGENYRVTCTRGPDNQKLTKHDYDLYGARTDSALLIGADHVSNFEYLGTLYKDDEYLDIRELPYERVIFSAINLGTDAKLEEWGSEGEPVFASIFSFKDGIDKGPDGRWIKGPAYYQDSANEKVDFSNKKWVSSLNYHPGIQENHLYDITGKEGWTGSLRIYFAKNKEALRTQNNNPNDFIDSGKDILPGETVRVKASTPYMIFGHYGKVDSTLENWSRDGIPANIDVVDSTVNSVYGPAYWADDSTSHEPDWGNPYWDVPLNSLESLRITRGGLYELEALPEMPYGIKYKLWFFSSEYPTEISRFSTNDLIIEKDKTIEFVALDDYLFFGAFNTGRDTMEEWSNRGEPVKVKLTVKDSSQLTGPAYYGSKNETNILTDFTNPHWEKINHWNESAQNRPGEGLTPVYFEKDNHYRITKTEAATTAGIDYGIYGAKTGGALIHGPSHNSMFKNYGLLNSSTSRIDVKSIQYPEVIFCTANDVTTKSLEDWGSKGEPAEIKVEQIVVDKDINGKNIEGPAYFQGSLNGQPNWNSDWWLGPLNYFPGFTKGKKYVITSVINDVDSNKGKLTLYWAPTLDSLDPLTNNVDYIKDSNAINIEPGESVTITAKSNYAIFGNYKVPNKDVITDWSRDGEPVQLRVEEYEFDETERGPLYWADGTKLDYQPWTDPHWTTPLNSYDTRHYEKDGIYLVKVKTGQDLPYDITFDFSDSIDANTPTPATEFTRSDVVLTKELARTGVILRILGRQMFLGARNLPTDHIAAKDLTYWNPNGIPCELELEEQIYDEGPEYWVVDSPVPKNWLKGLPDVRDSYWFEPWTFVEGIVKNKQYEISVPRGTKAKYTYYIWQTDKSRFSVNTKKTDFELLATIPVTSTDSVGATFTKKYVMIGVTETVEIQSDWSPLGRPTDLIFDKINTGRAGISYFADVKDTVNNAIGSSYKVEREIDWDNVKWDTPNNFRSATSGTGLNTMYEYKISLTNASPKYIYTIWTVSREGAKPGGGRAGRTPQGNITRNHTKVGLQKSTRIFPAHPNIMLAAFDFSGETGDKARRTLVNWSPNGEPVKLKIRKTTETLVPIPGGPILQVIYEVLEAISALLSLIFSLIGINKPEVYLVNFDEPQGLDEVPTGLPFNSVGHPLFMNKMADKESRFFIRWVSLRFCGYMLNMGNSKGASGGASGESHWYINTSFASIAATHSAGFIRTRFNGVRILPFQVRLDKSVEYHTRQAEKFDVGGVHVAPRQLVTQRNSVTEQTDWDNNKKWFDVGTAYMMRVPNSGSWYTNKYSTTWNGSGTPGPAKDVINRETFRENHNSSAKPSKNLGAVVPVWDSKWSHPSHYVENIFNDNGWVGFWRHDGLKSSKERGFHYVIGVMGDDNLQSGDGTPIWPVSEGGGPSTSMFYPGVQFDLSLPQLNKSDGDYQIAYFRMQVKDLEYYGTEELNKEGRYTNKARMIKMYPRYDCKYLFRDSTSVGTHKNDLWYQQEETPKRMTLVGSTQMDPRSQFVSAFSIGFVQGSWNNKEYEYAFKISNFKPLAFSKRPELIFDKKDYDRYN